MDPVRNLGGRTGACGLAGELVRGGDAAGELAGGAVGVVSALAAVGVADLAGGQACVGGWTLRPGVEVSQSDREATSSLDAPKVTVATLVVAGAFSANERS